jgi:hypothetical protein
MADQDIKPVTEGTPEETTPELAAESKEVEQPTVVEPAQKSETEILQEEIEALKAKNERHLQQLRGKDKLIEDLKTKEIAKKLDVVDKEPVTANNDEYTYDAEPQPEPTPARRQPQSSVQTEILVKSAISMNKNTMFEDYASDNVLPWNKEVAKQVEAEILRRDPNKTSILNEGTWETTYHLLRSKVASEKLAEQAKTTEKKTQAEADRRAKVLVEKEKAKQSVPVVETIPTKKVENNEFESDKYKLSAEQLKRKYPSLYAKSIEDRLWG